MTSNRWQRDPDWDRDLFPSTHEQRADERADEQRRVDGDLERAAEKRKEEQRGRRTRKAD